MKLSQTTLVAGLVIGFALFFIIALGGIALLATFAASMTVLISAPVLWLQGHGRRAIQLLAAWGGYLALYVTASTAMAILPTLRTPHPHAVGEEVCADAGCFAVERVERAVALGSGDDRAPAGIRSDRTSRIAPCSRGRSARSARRR